MELRVVHAGELKSFVEESSFAALVYLPITPLRAVSQAHNPNAEKDDPVLIIAYDAAQEVIAFLGCIPDVIQNAEQEKVCWNSGWWAHPEKGKIAVMPVFYKGLQLWKGKMLFDALPVRSKEILSRMGHFSFRSIKGLITYGRFKFHKIIPERQPVLKRLTSVFYLLDQVLNIPVKMRIAWWRRRNALPPNVQVLQLDNIDQSTFSFIKKHAENDLLSRSLESFNWPIDFPWVSLDKSYLKKYHFSSQTNRFENILLKIKEAGEIIGFVWLTYRDGTVKLPYCYVEAGKATLVVKVIGHQLSQLPFEAFISYQSNILEELEKTSFPFSFKRKTRKDFGWSKLLDSIIPMDAYIQDGDGDGVFT